MTDPVVLDEFQQRPEVRTIDHDTAAALRETGLVKVAPAPGGRWGLRATGKVGAVRIGDLDVQVQPKMGISRLLFLIGYAKNPNFRPEDAPGAAEADLWPALAESLVRYAERALARGPIRGYASVDAASPVLRGRMRVADQIGARPGQSFPLEVRYDEHTTDVVENRLLRTALRSMADVPRLPDGIPARIARLDAHLGGAGVLADTRSIPEWSTTRLNAHYTDALRIAEIVLRHQSTETDPGGMNVASFVVPVHQVFEDFVTVALRESFTRLRGRVDDQFRGHLDNQRTIQIRADVIVSTGSGTDAVLDAKYKFQDKSGNNTDHFQIVSYCTALAATTGCLVYAHGLREPEWLSVRNSPIRILRFPLDLEAPPTTILRKIGELAEQVLGPLRTGRSNANLD
ncbi:McrC family protein [Glycomyces xiaoerkulensis]|uniref:McrC family protein n=1 Tax=Glycomyces xiaoerkulensis TaxID=2038139 RepID=UPI000C26A743|nr:restriction endonuclease [Glycomyces xiaoerkulensis]